MEEMKAEEKWDVLCTFFFDKTELGVTIYDDYSNKLYVEQLKVRV